MKTYRFFGLVDLECHTSGHRGYERFFDNEYDRITDPRSKVADRRIVLHVVPKLPERRMDDIVRVVRFKRLFTYRFLVRDLEREAVEIFFQRHPVDRVYMNAVGVFLQAHVLEPVMYLKLLEKGVILLHAAGVAKDGAGFLLPAPGGTGKTTFSLALVNHGFRLLGDDLVLVDTNARIVHPYARPLHLFTYNVKSISGGRVPWRIEGVIYAKSVVRWILEKLLRTEFLIATRVHIDEIVDRDVFAPAVAYKGMWLLRSDGREIQGRVIDEEMAQSVARELIEASDLNKSLYRITEGDAAIASIKELERKVLERLLLQLKHVTYVNIRRLDLRSLDPFIETILGVNSPPASSGA